MADVSCSVSVSRKHSDASGVSSKHIYDGVFSAPAPRKLRDSAFSFRVDDYREIFSPSKASLGLSIPTLDLPAVDQSDSDCWSSSVDYAGVFGGLGDDGGVEISADELFLKSKRRSKRNSRRSRSSKQMKIKTPKGQESSCVSGDNQTSTSPAQANISPSEIQELCGSSRNNQASTSVSPYKSCDIVEDFSDSHHKTNQSKDGTDGTASIACLHSAPQNTPMLEEVGPSRKTELGEANRMSMDDGEGRGQGKHTRAISDLGIDKEANDHEAGLQKEFDRDKCYAFDASHSTQEVNCESQTYMEPTLSSSPQIFMTNHNFSKSSSQSSKSSTSYQQVSAAADLSPLLDQELDVNSAAAASAAAMKRAIEEAEAEIRLAKEFLIGKEINGPGKLSFKDIFKVKTASETNHSYEACGLSQDGSPRVDATVQNQSVHEDNVVQQEDDLSDEATSENNDFHEACGLKSQNNLNAAAITEDHIEEEDDSLLQPECLNGAEFEDIANSVEVLKSAEKSHKYEGIGEWEPAKQFSQLLTGVKNRFVSFISKQADTEKTVIQETKPSSSRSMEQSERISYQVQDADAHMRAAGQYHLEKEVEMNGSASSDFGESARDSNRVGIAICKTEENDVMTSVALEQEKVEVAVSSDVKMPITEQSDPSESEKVEEVKASPDVKMPITEQSDPSEPEKESDKVEVQEYVEVKHMLMQKNVQDQTQAIVEESMKREGDEKSEVDNNELEQHGMTLEATYETRRNGSTERDCEYSKGTEEQVQIQGAVEKEVYESLDGEDGNWRQEEGFIRVDIEMPIDCEKEIKDIERVEDTITEELEESVLATELCTREYSEIFAFQDVKGKAPVGLIEVANDTYEHDGVCEYEHDKSLLLSQNKEACVLFERSKCAQLGESSSEVEGRVENLATNPIESKVSDEQLIIEPMVNEEQPIIETQVNEEQPIIEPQVNDEQPIIEPKVNEEQPIIEPKVNEEQPIIEPKVNEEQQIIELQVNDEQQIIEPKVNEEQPIIEPNVNDEQKIIEPKVSDEEPIIVPKVNDEHLIIEPMVNDEQQIIEPLVDDEQPIFESQLNGEYPIIEPEVDIAQPIIEPEVNDGQVIIEPEENGGQPIIEPKVNEGQPIIEPKVNVEQPIFFEIANQLDKEEITEQARHAFEVVANIFPEHGNYFPAVDVCELDEKSSLNRTEEASGCDYSNRHIHDVNLTFEKEGMTQSTNTTSENKGRLEQPSFVHTVNELIEKEMCEPAGFSIEVTYEILDHDVSPPPVDDVCMTKEHPYLNGKDKDYGHSDSNQCAQKVTFSFEDERVTESPVITSEPEMKDQLSSVQTATSFIVEDKTEKSSSAGEPDVMEDTHEATSHTNILKVQRETDLNVERKRVDEEVFTTDIGPENQVDEFVSRTDKGEFDMDSDQEKTTYDVETSNKRKRWFEKDEIYQTDMLLGDEINQEVDQENTEGSRFEDRVEIHFDEIFGEYYSGLEDGHCTEPTHQRRRWFQYSGEEAMHKPIVFNVAVMTSEMDDEIVEESELDDSFRDCVDNLENENKEPEDVQDKDTAHAGPAPRRRKWFENGEKSGPAKRPSIFVDNVIDPDPKEIKIRADAAIHEEPGEKSTSGVMSNKPIDQLNDSEALKEKERMAVERAIREARQRAFSKARKKAAAAAKDKQKKASEAKTGSGIASASTDEKLRVERAAVERATAEARERALHKAVSAKMAYEFKEKDPKNQTSGSSCSKGYASEPFASETSSGATSESPQRSKSVSERNRQTMERAAKALEEKNMRDSIAQKEQAEREMFADALDGEVKRWLIGKDGNLRSLLSTLQYILGPDSGWQPIPLTDLIDPTAVRKAYKRAALCVHPDKLQQRGATVQQKYICEKVFDLLKDAWHWHELCPDDI